MTENAKRTDKPPSVDRLSLLWRRINDHKMVQWSVAYIALAYGIQHGVILTSESFEWPNAVARISMLLLVLGLPMVMTFAWYHGARASRNFSQAELSILAALLVIGSLLFYAFVRPTEEVAAVTTPAVQQVGIASGALSTAQPGGISIAVLPFVNLSSDKEQEFFSDGMTEEITSALAKVPNLRVVARTSAFQFKGENRDIQAIAQALHATHLIEGSVRKDGNQLRITAQLIKADDGTHIWTESYDRELKGVFVVQEEIASAIAGALRVPLGLQQGESLVPNRTADLDSYQQYLVARLLVHARTMDKAIAILEPLVARDQNYAPASALLAYAEYLLFGFYSPPLRTGSIEEARRGQQVFLDRATIAARRAIQTDPKNAFAYGTLATIQYAQGKWPDAEDLFRQALTLDANDPEILQAYGNMLVTVGRLKDALTVREKERTLEPLIPIYAEELGNAMQLNGRPAASIPILEAVSADSAGAFYRDVWLAKAYAETGRFKEAADTLLLSTGNQVTRQSVEDAAGLLRKAPAKVAAPETLKRFDSELNFVYAYVGAPDRVLEFAERNAEIGFVAVGAYKELWHPSAASSRKTERFRTYVHKMGLVDYWRAKGWPDLCHPTTGDDFACN